MTVTTFFLFFHASHLLFFLSTMAIIYPIWVYCKGNFLDFKIFIYSNE
ncbi:hypothetical protein COPCOM_02338 [Coprococcus comes ATCC 27758]|uniref:Uncharacterized protein n=1 Tax=Coprococcus comes ATCC 27758 TaxID=470146 RepID=C0BB82_9FIRM|nr:hypothetical protein COPCOM_02338 [Coprococcus comes ATCC 27758]